MAIDRREGQIKSFSQPISQGFQKGRRQLLLAQTLALIINDGVALSKHGGCRKNIFINL
jgi:hypothetical protein